MITLLVPPYLRKESKIAITCSSFALTSLKFELLSKLSKERQISLLLGKTVTLSDSVFPLPPKDRLQELNTFLKNDSIQAILFGRGGYGLTEIIDNINWKYLQENPKWLIGFSDITLLHCTLLNKTSYCSLHAPMASSFNKDKCNNIYLEETFNLLEGKKLNFTTKDTLSIHNGDCKGKLVGGNLSMIAHSIGTNSQLQLQDCILVLEDVGEYLYTIERMLYQLKRSGIFTSVKGIILGNFSRIKSLNKPFGKTPLEMFKSFFSYLKIPICYNFPIGHEKENLPFKHGKIHHLIVQKNETCLIEIDDI